ncbi:4-oxalomesaconate tautomerase [Pararhodobacter zhoushanensis]|uniref:4-oxalomesaconate tautomerase n=1 Tax=Pararhodobacter zhoushanensis TaxID=2479545 RepID=A0ABT3H565_9RHOB|nr:4-oxalomesaconate tautomerase [Pararhodobacter zhoushanensis]MCW1934941.1 4-oxalomesaconate tautomerase [Pararhodobacter zhoushanensis]
MPTIPCVLMRGGTSRGPVFLASDLPANTAARDAMLISALGSGHPLQIDGIGGGNALTSKVAIVGPATVPGADVDYLFAQVNVERALVDTAPNCGNMLAAVGPYAIERGLVTAGDPLTRLVIHNVNTGKLIEATVETPNARVTYDGTTAIAGVPGTAAPIRLAFLDAAGSKTGKFLPSGQIREMIDGYDVSLIDMAVAAMMADARSFGKTGGESPAALDGDRSFMAQLEAIRLQAGRAMGLGNVADLVIPKPILVSPPAAGGTIRARYFMPHSCHTAVAVTGAVCIAAACCTPGSVAHALAALPQPDAQGRRLLQIEHPSGSTPIEIEQNPETGEVTRVSVIRTARRILDGVVHVRDVAA